MVNYELGKIYKLVSPSGLTYIGSTALPTLAKRLGKHKDEYKRYLKGLTKYISAYKLFDEDVDNVKIFLVQEFSCSSRDQLHKREREVIENTECVNLNIPWRQHGESNQVWKEKNIEQFKAYQKLYTAKNKNWIKKKQGKKHKCICGGKYRHSNKSYHIQTKRHNDFLSFEQRLKEEDPDFYKCIQVHKNLISHSCSLTTNKA